MKKFLNNIWTSFTSGIAAKIAAGLVVLATLIGGVLWGIFSDGVEVRKYQEAELIFDSIMSKKMKDPVYAAKVAVTILETPEVKTFAEKKSNDTQQKLIELTNKDSINLREELRFYMDLRESQRVTEELGKMYHFYTNFNHILDSMLINHYDLRRRSNNNVIF